ncbi:MAG: hypothetical protein EBY86_04055, partial [Acidimicrobiia bacterium]|nr:hypothetical protein [Acidimicrobiia bacterium]
MGRERFALLRRSKYQKPGNVFLGVVHRLDRPTSGALVFARTGTKWWHETVTSASLVCFISGRLKFI